jgi:hypothetical protein
MRAMNVVLAAWRQRSPLIEDMKMKPPVISRLLAMAVMVVFSTLSFSALAAALAGWSLPLPEGLPQGTPEPLPLLFIGAVLTAAGLFQSRSQ